MRAYSIIGNYLRRVSVRIRTFRNYYPTVTIHYYISLRGFFIVYVSRACTPLRKGYILLKTGNRHPHIVYVYYHSVLL